MRISERQRYSVAHDRVERAKEQNVTALSHLSSQKRINHLHDDPVGVTQVLRGRDEIADSMSYLENMNFTRGSLEVTESAITGIVDRLSRVHELSIAMANDTYGPTSRRATAREIDEIINEVIQLANSRYNNRFIFSGFRTSSPALDQDGVYLGDDGAIFVQIEQGNFKQINIPGRELFELNEGEIEDGHVNMVDLLISLRDSLDEDSKVLIYKGLEELSFHIDRTGGFQASVGAISAAVDEASRRVEYHQDQVREQISKVEDADIYKATSDFKRTETVLQSTLLASNKFLQPSLLNFMQ